MTRSCGTWWSVALPSLANEALTKAITPKLTVIYSLQYTTKLENILDDNGEGMKRVEEMLETARPVKTGHLRRSFLLQSHKLIGPMVDQIVQAIQLNGIIVRFECPTLASVREGNEDTMSDRDKARLRLRNHMETRPLTLVYVKGLGGRPPTGHWPIPEAFWHDRIE
ncbi:hypothetical protein RB195_005838 [Necator americanus]|uniref:Uncharacterized protein n=1 Tax=Necator americanus TaxID=51031 RepID=A0ABR1BTN1_NECAM